MRFTVLTLFPDMIRQGLSTSILGRAEERGFISFDIRNIRDYTTERHGHVDDAPYGGGAGMLMQADPILRCYRGGLAEGTAGHLCDAAGQTVHAGGRQDVRGRGNSSDSLRALRGGR